MEITRLGRMHNSYKSDANLDEVFVILTIGASMIATLGLQANSAAVVIGAMVVAPWIMPLRASAFAVLIGDLNLLLGSLKTLFVGVVITIILSALLGEITDLPRLGSEVMDRTSPTLLDLGIAIVAGGMASYAKLRSDAISSLAGTAIAVALVPPVCVMGILLSYQHWNLALGAGLLFATNLLGILMGGLVMMAWKEPFFRQRLRESNFSAANFLLTGGLTALLLIPLTSSFLNLVGQSRRQSTREQIEYTIKTFLKHETLTFGGEGVDLAQLNIAWDKNPPEIHVLIYVSNPKLPTVKQVSAVQEAINKRQGLDYQLIVQRVVVIEGPEEIPNLITKEDAELIKEPTPIINPLPRTKKEQEISKDEPEEGREIKPEEASDKKAAAKDNTVKELSIEDLSIEDHPIEDLSIEDLSIKDLSIEDFSSKDNAIKHEEIKEETAKNEPDDEVKNPADSQEQIQNQITSPGSQIKPKVTREESTPESQATE